MLKKTRCIKLFNVHAWIYQSHRDYAANTEYRLV